MNKKVLILGYHDSPAEGHAYSFYVALKAKGYEAYFVSLLSEYLHDTPAYFIDSHNKWTPSYLWYSVNCKVRSNVFPAVKGAERHCFFNTGNYYVADAKSILAKIPMTPDVIILGWVDFYVSPKVLYDLYKETQAKIVIPMLDHHLLGGGCHYPCECRQFETGCSSCPAIKHQPIAARLYQEKVDYFKEIPFTVVGTSYDLMRAQKVPFLQGKEMIRTIGTPTIPFVKSKAESRKAFGIDDGDFVIMCGAYSLSDRRKGFKYILTALENVSKKRCNRNITLLLLGDGGIDTNFGDGIKVLTPGFLNLEQLFTAYYAADVFVSPSVDDSGPYMVNYSIACGTPVTSFPIGVSLDLVKHRETGYLAKFLDAEDLANGLLEFCNMPQSEFKVVSDNCLNLMEDLRKNNTPWFFRVLE